MSFLDQIAKVPNAPKPPRRRGRARRRNKAPSPPVTLLGPSDPIKALAAPVAAPQAPPRARQAPKASPPQTKTVKVRAHTRQIKVRPAPTAVAPTVTLAPTSAPLAGLVKAKKQASKKTTKALAVTERHVTLPSIPKLPASASDDQRYELATKVFDAARKFNLDTPEKIAALPPQARRTLNRAMGYTKTAVRNRQIQAANVSQPKLPKGFTQTGSTIFDAKGLPLPSAQQQALLHTAPQQKLDTRGMTKTQQAKLGRLVTASNRKAHAKPGHVAISHAGTGLLATITPHLAGNPIAAIAHGLDKTPVGQGIANTPGDFINLAANAIPSTYHLATTLFTRPGKAAQELAQPYIHIVEDPEDAIRHPLPTYLELAGIKGALGRSAGRVARSGVLGSTVKDAASLTRDAQTLPGMTMVKTRSYSPDLIDMAVQKGREAVRSRKATKLRSRAAETPDEVKADALLARAHKLDRKTLSEHEIRTRMDERVGINAALSMKGRARIQKAVADTGIAKFGPLGSLVAQRIVKPTRASIEAYRDHIASHAVRDALSDVELAANKTMVRSIDAELAKDHIDFKALAKAADDYAELTKPGQIALGKAGIFHPDQIDRRVLQPYAVRHMGAQHAVPHDVLVAAELARQAIHKTETEIEARLARMAKTNPDRARLENDLAAVRRRHRMLDRATEEQGQLAGPDGHPLTNDEIRAHMEANDVGEPAFLTQAPNRRGARNFWKSSHEPAYASRARFTGRATHHGTFDAHPDTLVENAVNTQQLAAQQHGFKRMIHEFGFHTDKGLKTFTKYSDAERLRSSLELGPHGVEWQIVRVNPFAGSKHQLEALLEPDHPDHLAMHTSVLHALEGGGGGDGPFALIPKAAAKHLAQHVRIQGSGGGGLLLQKYTSLWRKAVLVASPKWLFGNSAEAIMRAFLHRAGPGSWLTAHRTLKSLEDLHPAVRDEVMARAMNGGHYTMASRYDLHRGAAQFKHTRLEGIANAISAFSRAPGPRQAGLIWHRYSDFVFHTVNGRIEHEITKAIWGKELRKSPLMDDHLRKASQAAVDDAARGLVNTNNQVELARATTRAYGKYDLFSPAQKRLIVLYTPFMAWTANALRFVLSVLPRDHPVVTSLLAAANRASQGYLMSQGLDESKPGALPPFLQGTIPFGGGHVPASRYTPFGAFTDLPGTLAGDVLPQLEGALAAGRGTDWKGSPLKDETTPGKAKAALLSVLTGVIPGFGQITSAATKGLEGLNPVHPIKGKSKGSSSTPKYSPAPSHSGGYGGGGGGYGGSGAYGGPGGAYGGSGGGYGGP